jgi:hypothetical protein
MPPTANYLNGLRSKEGKVQSNRQMRAALSAGARLAVRAVTNNK